MEKDVCIDESHHHITVSGTFGNFEADEEPYENGKKEVVSDDDEYLIRELELYVGASICATCKKAYFWSEDGKLIAVQDFK